MVIKVAQMKHTNIQNVVSKLYMQTIKLLSAKDDQRVL